MRARRPSSTHSKRTTGGSAPIVPIPTVAELAARVGYEPREWPEPVKMDPDRARRAVRKAVREAAAELSAPAEPGEAPRDLGGEGAGRQ